MICNWWSKEHVRYRVKFSFQSSTSPLLPDSDEHFNSSPPGQNGRLFADDIFECIFVNGSLYILVKISLKFVLKDLIDNNPALGLDNGLASNRRQAIIWTNANPIHWRMYAALGGDELQSHKHSTRKLPDKAIGSGCRVGANIRNGAGLQSST